MSQMPSRSTVFLDAMGVGPQWRLRNPPPALLLAGDAPDNGEREFADAVAGLIASEAASAGAARAGTVPVAMPVAASASDVAPSAPAVTVSASVTDDTASAGQEPAAVEPDDAFAPALAFVPAALLAPGASAPAAQEQERERASEPAGAIAGARVEPSAASARAPASSAASKAPVLESAAEIETGAAMPAIETTAATPAIPAALPAASPASMPSPVRAPASAVAPASDESTAWFDDAPVVPAMRPAPAAVPAVPAARGPVSADAIANMDWAALRAAISACTRCELCHTRKAAVPGRGDAHASWLLLATAPSRDDELGVEALSGQAGLLLNNMLKAIDLAPDEDAYVTTLVKCRPPGADGADRLPNADELAACRPYLERELELAGTRIIVTLGHSAGKGLLGAAARGKVLRHDGIPTVATYHPADLLRKPADKARAWHDLCLARAAHAGRA
ncbi:MAG: uracil-DNA glycosylase [Pseudomonadota bacterium]